MTRVGTFCAVAAIMLASCSEAGPGGSPQAASSAPISWEVPADPTSPGERDAAPPRRPRGAQPIPGAAAAPWASPAPPPPPDADEPPWIGRAAAVSVVMTDPVGGDTGWATGSLEPVVATHPTDASLVALAYTRARGAALVGTGIRISTDGGRTWRESPAHPCDGSGRVPSLHAALAWGLGPTPSGILYWTGTTTARGGGDLRVAIASSVDLGRTWSRLYVPRETPAWVGGYPDITVAPHALDPGGGVAYVVYNHPLGGRRGSGIRLLASTDAGSSWSGVEIEPAPASGRRQAVWRFAPRVRTGPDGSVFVSAYQADLHAWDPSDVFDRGGPGNVVRAGVTLTRVTLEPATGHLAAGPTVMATTFDLNGLTTSRLVAPGTRSHTYLDPMWSHGLDVDEATGRVYLAIGRVTEWSEARPRGTIVVGRSDDLGTTWTWVEITEPPNLDGWRQSSFRPSIVASGSTVVVGLRTIDDPTPDRARRTDARIGVAVAVSVDGGRTFSTPTAIGTPWRASTLATAVNGPGLRERIERTADGRVVFAFGSGPEPATRTSTGPARRVLVGLLAIRADTPSRAR